MADYVTVPVSVRRRRDYIQETAVPRFMYVGLTLWKNYLQSICQYYI